MTQPFGELLKKYRENNGLTQIDLAEKLGVTQQSIVYLENRDYVKPSTKKDIEEKIGFNLDSLLPGNSAFKDAKYYQKQAIIYKEMHDHCTKMAKLLGG